MTKENKRENESIKRCGRQVHLSSQTSGSKCEKIIKEIVKNLYELNISTIR